VELPTQEQVVQVAAAEIMELTWQVQVIKVDLVPLKASQEEQAEQVALAVEVLLP
jgi:hypothetical protein